MHANMLLVMYECIMRLLTARSLESSSAEMCGKVVSGLHDFGLQVVSSVLKYMRERESE